MALPVWPTSLPTKFQVQGFQAGRIDGRSVFRPEKGPPIRRRGLILPFRVYQGDLPPISPALVTTLEDFYEDDLGEGTLPFVFPLDPLDGTANIIVTIDGMIIYSPVSGTLFRPSLALIRLP